MTKTTATILKVIGGVIVFGGGGYLVYQAFRKAKVKKDNTPATAPPPANTPAPTPTITPAVSAYPLKSGSKGALVKELQNILNDAGASPALVVDGIFGPKTQSALVKFYGKTQIATATDYGAFKAQVQTQGNANTNFARGQMILTSYGSSESSQVYTVLEAPCRVIVVNSDGTYTDTGVVITFDKLSLFPHDRFVPQAVSTMGDLRAEYTTPVLPVTYTVLVNPSTLQVK